ncbi:stalk domain-containing protein [Paenibacillus sp. FSL K6-2441]|uniref:stalk domain-containing protein n=1 Tax=Paenibacillus TaxID=44249 RepID=UPI0030DD3C5B
MKCKKILIMLMAFFLFSTTAYAISEKNFSVFINDVKKELPLEQLMIVKDRVFVPLRFISESMGVVVGYDSNQKNVFIVSNKIDRAHSKLHSKANNTDFELKLLSNKEKYKYGEPIMIWSTLTSVADQRISIQHGTPLITYYLEDSDGFKFSEMQASIATNSDFEPGDEEIRIIPHHLFLEYHLQKNKVTEVEKYLEKYLSNTAYPAALPKGKYTISASVEYSKAQESAQLYTELEIIID